MTESLWGSEFTIAPSKSVTKKILQKASKPLSVEKRVNTKSKSISIEEKINLVKSEVNRILGRFSENITVIDNYEDLVSYIDSAIENGVISIDTETNNSLDPITCKLMGACIYTPGCLWAYVPVNHINRDTEELLPNQLTEKQIKKQFDRLKNTKIIMHNAKFDYEVIKCTCDCELEVYWDTIIGARLLNENEDANLKYQYISKIDPSIEKYNIEHLFNSLPYEIFSPDLFSLYAATDAYMTYKLYEYQVKEFSKTDNQNLYKLFREVEMPIIKVCTSMELAGVCLDTERAKRLSVKYHEKLIPIEENIKRELDKYKDTIAQWRTTEEANFHPRSQKPNKNGEFILQKSKSEQLSDPPELTSTTQLAILLYDILKTPVVDKKSPRGTGEEILQEIKLPLCKLILEKRGIEKLLGTYIDKLPQCINSKTGRIHASFNQLGTVTGRFSSNNPNLQNIPSHLKEIRTMFIPGPGKVFVGADFS